MCSRCRHAFHRSCLAPNSTLCVICHQIPVVALSCDQEAAAEESSNQIAPQTAFMVLHFLNWKFE